MYRSHHTQICICAKLTVNWNLSRRVNRKSKVKRATGTFKTFKPTETYGTAPMLMQHRTEYLVSPLLGI
jgi:hypothetical protein